MELNGCICTHGRVHQPVAVGWFKLIVGNHSVVVISETVEMCRQAVAAGVSWITVHGRTPAERCQPVHVDAIRLLADCIHVPIIANGDIKSLSDAENIRQQTGASGLSLYFFDCDEKKLFSILRKKRRCLCCRLCFCVRLWQTTTVQFTNDVQIQFIVLFKK